MALHGLLERAGACHRLAPKNAASEANRSGANFEGNSDMSPVSACESGRKTPACGAADLIPDPGASR